MVEPIENQTIAEMNARMKQLQGDPAAADQVAREFDLREVVVFEGTAVYVDAAGQMCARYEGEDAFNNEGGYYIFADDGGDDFNTLSLFDAVASGMIGGDQEED